MGCPGKHGLKPAILGQNWYVEVSCYDEEVALECKMWLPTTWACPSKAPTVEVAEAALGDERRWRIPFLLCQ